MSRTANIIISTIMWCAIAGYIVAAGMYGRERRAEIAVKEVRIDIVDTADIRTVSHAKVARWLKEANIDPVGQSVNGDNPPTRAIEECLAARPEVRHVSARTDLEGVLTVRIEQRVPMMRVRTANGYRFWYTTDGVILADRGDFPAHVPVVTGNIPFPFSAPPSSQGSYAEILRADFNDYLGRFTALETERRSLVSQLSDVGVKIRNKKAEKPSRFRSWFQSEEDKKNFAKDKAARLVELRAEESKLEKQLAQLASQKSVLMEKEKKSRESHRFLSKLANFVKFIGRNDFWAAQIVQINVLGGGRNAEGGVAGINLWREPQLELIPRAGDHIVLLGELDGGEAERLEKLRLFYTRGLAHEGWDKYGYIDIKYKDQIVCK